MATRRKTSDDTLNTMTWLLTYSDMITLLLTFFVLLITMSSLEVAKVKEFQTSTVDAMGILLEGRASEMQPKQIVASGERIDEQVLGTERFLKQYAGLKTQLLKENERGDVEFKKLERGMSIILRDDLLFQSGEAAVSPGGISVLNTISASFKDFDGEVMVEGHTDNMPIRTDDFPSNWELSTTRAVTVLRQFSENLGIDPAKLSAVGYADTRPIVPNESPENQRINRRVEIILVPNII